MAALDVARRWAIVLAGALLAACACVLLALVVSRWLLRPLKELDRGVRAVAEGQRRAHVADTAGPAELRALSESFNRMSDAVAEAADQQRRLIADASHQLRNPMAALRLRVDMLPSRTARLLTEVERLESLLDGLLALASAESTATERAAGGREPELADLQAVAHDRVDAWRAAAGAAGVTITVDDRAPGLVRCAVSDLAQVLDVVLDNAIKYGGGGVTVVCDRARLIVRDNGPGLSTEDIERATERFWRGDDIAARHRPGPGHRGTHRHRARRNAEAAHGRRARRDGGTAEGAAAVRRRTFLLGALALIGVRPARTRPVTLKIAGGEPGGFYIDFAALLSSLSPEPLTITADADRRQRRQPRAACGTRGRPGVCR